MNTAFALLLLFGLTAAQDPARPQDSPPQDMTRVQIIEADIKEAIAKLESDQYEEASRARGELVQLGKAATDALISALRAGAGEEEKKVRVRFFICEILGEIRDERAVEALIERLDDHSIFSDRVAVAAAASLGMLGSEKAIPALIKKLESDMARIDNALKGELITALGNLRAKEAEDVLIKFLDEKDKKTREDEGENSQARVIAALAAEALAKIRSRKAVPELVKLVDDQTRDPMTEETLHKIAVTALQRIRGERDKKFEDVEKWAREEKARLEKEKKRQEAQAKIEETRKTMAQIQEALEKYKAKHNQYPKTLAELKPEFWAQAGEFKDGWKRDFAYREPGTGGQPYDLISYGDDGREGGGDIDADLWNHDAWKKVKLEQTHKILKDVADKIEAFNRAHGQYPASLMELMSRPAYVKPDQWPKEPYLTALPKDGFGNDLVYRKPGKDGKPFDLLSYGNDRVEGGADIDADISVWSIGWNPPPK